MKGIRRIIALLLVVCFLLPMAAALAEGEDPPAGDPVITETTEDPPAEQDPPATEDPPVTEDPTVLGDPPVAPVLVSTVSVTAENGAARIAPHETLQLIAAAEPVDAADASVAWQSSDTAVATVDASGLVTGVGAGEATITATAADGGGASGTFVLTVAEWTLAEQIAKGGRITYEQDLALEADMEIPAGVELTLTGALTVPAGRTLSVGGALTLTGEAEIMGTLAIEKDGALTVAGGAAVLVLPAPGDGDPQGSGAIDNAGALDVYGALTFAEGTAFTADSLPATVYGEGSVTGSGNVVYPQPALAAMRSIDGGIVEVTTLTALLDLLEDGTVGKIVTAGDIKVELPEAAMLSIPAGVQLIVGKGTTLTAPAYSIVELGGTLEVEGTLVVDKAASAFGILAGGTLAVSNGGCLRAHTVGLVPGADSGSRLIARTGSAVTLGYLAIEENSTFTVEQGADVSISAAMNDIRFGGRLEGGGVDAALMGRFRKETEVRTAEALIDAVSQHGWGEHHVRLVPDAESVTLADKLVVPKNTELYIDLQTESFTLALNGGLENHGRINARSHSDPGCTLRLTEDSVNYGTIELPPCLDSANVSELDIPAGKTLRSFGQLLLMDGALVRVNGTLSIEDGGAVNMVDGAQMLVFHAGLPGAALHIRDGGRVSVGPAIANTDWLGITVGNSDDNVEPCTLTIDEGGTLLLKAGELYFRNNGTVVNNGRVILEGGSLRGIDETVLHPEPGAIIGEGDTLSNDSFSLSDTVYLNTDATLTTPLTIPAGKTLVVNEGKLLRFASGWHSLDGTLVNRGTVIVSGATLDLNGTFENRGELSIVGGTLNFDGVLDNYGRLSTGAEAALKRGGDTREKRLENHGEISLGPELTTLKLQGIRIMSYGVILNQSGLSLPAMEIETVYGLTELIEAFDRGSEEVYLAGDIALARDAVLEIPENAMLTLIPHREQGRLADTTLTVPAGATLISNGVLSIEGSEPGSTRTGRLVVDGGRVTGEGTILVRGQMDVIGGEVRIGYEFGVGTPDWFSDAVYSAEGSLLRIRDGARVTVAPDAYLSIYDEGTVSVSADGALAFEATQDDEGSELALHIHTGGLLALRAQGSLEMPQQAELRLVNHGRISVDPEAVVVPGEIDAYSYADSTGEIDDPAGLLPFTGVTHAEVSTFAAFKAALKGGTNEIMVTGAFTVTENLTVGADQTVRIVRGQDRQDTHITLAAGKTLTIAEPVGAAENDRAGLRIEASTFTNKGTVVNGGNITITYDLSSGSGEGMLINAGKLLDTGRGRIELQSGTVENTGTLELADLYMSRFTGLNSSGKGTVRILAHGTLGTDRNILLDFADASALILEPYAEMMVDESNRLELRDTASLHIGENAALHCHGILAVGKDVRATVEGAFSCGGNYGTLQGEGAAALAALVNCIRVNNETQLREALAQGWPLIKQYGNHILLNGGDGSVHLTVPAGTTVLSSVHGLEIPANCSLTTAPAADGKAPGTLIVSEGSTLKVHAAGSLRNDGRTVVDGGQLPLGGELINEGELHLTGGSTLTAESGSLLANYGTMKLDGGAVVTVGNGGAMDINAGAVFDATGRGTALRFEQGADLDLLSGADFRLHAEAVLHIEPGGSHTIISTIQLDAATYPDDWMEGGYVPHFHSSVVPYYSVRTEAALRETARLAAELAPFAVRAELSAQVALTADLTLPERLTLRLTDGSKLTVPAGKTLYNFYQILIDGGGELSVAGTLVNGSAIEVYGRLLTTGKGMLQGPEDGVFAYGDATVSPGIPHLRDEPATEIAILSPYNLRLLPVGMHGQAGTWLQLDRKLTPERSGSYDGIYWDIENDDAQTANVSDGLLFIAFNTPGEFTVRVSVDDGSPDPVTNVMDFEAYRSGYQYSAPLAWIDTPDEPGWDNSDQRSFLVSGQKLTLSAKLLQNEDSGYRARYGEATLRFRYEFTSPVMAEYATLDAETGVLTAKTVTGTTSVTVRAVPVLADGRTALFEEETNGGVQDTFCPEYNVTIHPKPTGMQLLHFSPTSESRSLSGATVPFNLNTEEQSRWFTLTLQLLPLLGEDASNVMRNIQWTVSDPTLLTLAHFYPEVVQITPGPAADALTKATVVTITAKATDPTGTTRTTSVKVQLVRLATGVRIDLPEGTRTGPADGIPALSVGQALQLRATVLPEDVPGEVPKVSSRAVIWSFADPSYAAYASLSSTGRVTPKSSVMEGARVIVRATAKDGSAHPCRRQPRRFRCSKSRFRSGHAHADGRRWRWSRWSRQRRASRCRCR